MFKSYTSNDNLLLPPCLGDFIPQNDSVRAVRHITEQINLKELYLKYSSKGCSTYHPRMMLQILVYTYLRNVYSSRRIEELCRNDIRFMWLTDNVTPDHNTISRFYSSRLKDVLKTIFAAIVKFLVSEDSISFDVASTDGTKMEANANRYTFVWGRSIYTRIPGIAGQLEEIWQYVESVTRQELRDSTPVTHQDITPEEVEKALERVDGALNGVDADKKVKAKIKHVRKPWPEQLRKYESQGKILDGRNSYSKTDNDATFIRMKEDHMRNRQFKPGYNPQISTNKQFILNCTVHQCAGDTSTYPLYIDDFHSLYGRYPNVSVCDAGYGSEENYLYVFERDIETFIKYNYFHKEQKRNFRNDPFLSANFYYNEENDGMYCPMGQKMEGLSGVRRVTDSGFIQTVSRYRACNCKGCPLRCRCYKNNSGRIVQISRRLRKIREKEREKLFSDEDLKYRSRRPQGMKTVFGNLKDSKYFKRFNLRGLKKVEIEFGLLTIAHNLAKITSQEDYGSKKTVKSSKVSL